ncbi:MAG TPA: glycosyltransferase family 39 protein [Thermoanaerobaculia bacterium]|nr:glycosyltransferase family 39 protein [Thermoanaerobaculia bacterium]
MDRFFSQARAALPPLLLAVLVAGAAIPAQARALQVLVFAAMIAALAGTGWRTALWLMPDVRPLSRAVAAFTIAVAAASVQATWLGHFGRMRPAPFLLCVAAAYLLSRFLPARSPLPEETDSPQAPEGPFARAEGVLLLAAAASLVLAFAREVARFAFAPPGHGSDDLYYHLSAVAVWHRFGDLRMIKFSMGDWSTAYYPILPEISAWTFLAPFGDSDVAARWSQLPYFLFSLVALAAVARRLGVSPRGAALAMILYASIHKVLVHAFTAGNDHVTAFFTLAALDGALAAGHRPRPGRVVATGLSLGLLVASKYIGLYYAVTILLILGATLAVHWVGLKDEHPSSMSLPGLTVLLAVCMLLAGSYTYLRNAWTAGNPFYPAPITVFGQEILPGREETSVAVRMQSEEAEIDIPHFLTRRSDLFGPLFPYTLLPAALLAPLVAFARRRLLTGLALALPVVFFLQFLYLMYDHRDMRYFMAGVGLAAVCLAWLVDRPASWAATFRCLVLLLVTFHQTRRFGASGAAEVAGTLALVGLAALVPRLRKRLSGRRPAWRTWNPGWLGWAGAAIVLTLAAVSLGEWVETYQRVKLRDRPAAQALERIAGPGGARVAYAGLNQPYLYFGSRLQNDVRIVPRSVNLNAEHYRWGASIGLPYRVGPYRRWRQNLERLDVDLVVIVRSRWENPERRWIVQRPEHFRLVYEDADTEIWRVLLPGSGEERKRPAQRPARRQRRRATPQRGPSPTMLPSPSGPAFWPATTL